MQIACTRHFMLKNNDRCRERANYIGLIFIDVSWALNKYFK